MITPHNIESMVELSCGDTGIEELEWLVYRNMAKLPEKSEVPHLYRRFVYHICGEVFDRLGRNCEFLEIGCFKGHTSAAALMADANVTAIDNMKAGGNPKDLLGDKDRFAFFVGNSEGVLKSNVFKVWRDRYDVILYDAYHSYASVKKEIGLTETLWDEDSILLFDDAETNGIDRAIAERFDGNCRWMKTFPEFGGTSARAFTVVLP